MAALPPFDRAALARALAARPPRGVAQHADRLLARSAGADLDVFVDDAIAAAEAHLAAGGVDVVSVAVVVACAGVDVFDLHHALLRQLLFFSPPEVEPFAAVCGYWLARIDARPRPPVGPPPSAPLAALPQVSLRQLRFAHFSHLVFFAADYGRRAIDVDAARAAAAAAAAHVDVDCADSVASLLLAQRCLGARGDDALWARLGALQDAATGALSTSTKTETAAHHAACVAALAADLPPRAQTP